MAAALALGGCAAHDAPVGVHPMVVHEVLASAAQQVKRCYQSPRIARAGKQIITSLAVSYNADGTLAGLPAVVSQSGVTPANRVYAGRMAEAARLAVIRCAPLRLPPDQHAQIWSFFTLTFSPRGAA
jgi:hypothetical protein